MDNTPGIGFTVAQMVEQLLPSGFVVDPTWVSARQKWWQTLLADAAGISDTDKYTESKWLDEWNMLISYMIIWDIFQRALAGNIFTLFGVGANGTSGKQQPKTIKTGPTEVQYQDTAVAFAQLMKTITTDSSPFYAIFSDACMLANDLKIKLPFCPGNAQAFMFSKVMVGRCVPCQKVIGPGGMFGPPSTGGIWNSGENYIP